MGEIVSAYIFPHPPIVIPEVGKGEETAAHNTIESMKRASKDIHSDRPTTIIITSPHGPVFSDFIYISETEKLTGDLKKFNAKEVALEFLNNRSLVKRIEEASFEVGIPAGDIDNMTARKYKISRELDHGAMVPLYFVSKETMDFKLVHIATSGLALKELYKFGMCIAKAVKESDERVVFLASGDLSHRLSHDGPYGYNENAEKFDRLFVECIEKLEIEKLISVDNKLSQSAGECGLRSFIMMLGALDGQDIESEVYSYEGPFGVGYSVARLGIGGKSEKRKILNHIESNHKKSIEQAREKEDDYVALARKALETYIVENRIISVPQDLPRELIENRAGVFVSIKKEGQLRGCIGTIAPVKRSIAEEIIHNAIQAGAQDPRFHSVEKKELENLIYSVDILMKAEPISSIQELDIMKYGVIVRAGMRSGLLLPDIHGINSPEEQVNIALQKAGIKPNENYSMERFEVIRHY